MNRKRLSIFTLLAVSVVTIGLLHALTPGDRIVLHDIYRRVSYLPIVIAAILYGLRGGLILAAGTSVAFIPHLRHFYLLGPSAYLAELPEVVLYFAAGIVTGAIAGREQKIRIRYQELAHRLQRTNRKLRKQARLLVKAEEQLRSAQKLSALGTLSASLAHEIKNPLAAIRGAAEILADDLAPDHPKREFADILLSETSRLSRTVREILDFAGRQKAGRTTGVPAPLVAVIDQVRTLAANTLRKHNIRLKIELAPAVRRSPLDRDRMKQVFLNLILNGCEAIGRDGEITIRASENDSHLLIRFQDTGPGIPPEIRPKIFTPFFTTRQEGSGLGLTISSRIVESCGGRLELEESQDVRGACFLVRLPRPSILQGEKP